MSRSARTSGLRVKLPATEMTAFRQLVRSQAATILTEAAESPDGRPLADLGEGRQRRQRPVGRYSSALSCRSSDLDTAHQRVGQPELQLLWMFVLLVV
ncbi:hypothetical protein [Nonomuraea sp. CA-141351]|uniref:hypothetical protein n=1 Tax=Nonomuraea sp. CA-141351 TaxID=3239996 RepID=UPI003D92507B